jgi:hypothetical protein
MTQYNIVDMIRSGADVETIARFPLDEEDVLMLTMEYVLTKNEDRQDKITALLAAINKREGAMA